MKVVMRNRMRFIILMVLISLQTGCSLFAPGMHMNTGLLTPSVNSKDQIVTSQMQWITADLILKQKKLAEKKQADAIAQYRIPYGFAAHVDRYQYHVKPQDVLQIVVWNQVGFSGQNSLQTSLNMNAPTNNLASTAKPNNPSNSTSFVVSSNGTIFYPYLGNVAVMGKTISQIRTIISDKMSHFFSNPQVTVDMLSFNSQRVAITGAVVKPTTLPITNVPLDVLTAVTQAGGPIRCGASTSTSSATFCADLHDVEIRRGHRVVKVDLNKLTAINGSSNNWILQDRDTVYIPNNNASRIFVLGAVTDPSSYNMIDGRMTLREALGDARGVTTSSNPRYTYVIRDYHSNPQLYVLNLSSPDALNLAGEFQLKPSDIVYVSTSALSTFGQVMTDVSGPLLTAVAIKSLVN